MTRHALRKIAVAIACGVALAGGAAAQPVMPQIVQIGIDAQASQETATRMVAAVYRPPGEGKWPVVIYSHGRSGNEADRRRIKLLDPRGHVRYWLQKGFAVVAPIRPGYGDTGGADREYSGVRYDVFGNCWGPPDFGRAAEAASSAVASTLAWLRHQPWADAERIVLAGSSMGGLTSIASAATNPPGVIGYINFSGGTGGDSGRAPRHSCGSEDMAALMRTYGKTARVPGLWLYAENDLYWGAEWPRAWYRAFASAGSKAEFVMTDAVPNSDGHQLLARGERLWTEPVDRFLAELGLSTPVNAPSVTSSNANR
jgi:dienelactone hydrolase